MTIADTKEALAAALGEVDGITAYAVRPTVLTPGDAFIRWRGWARADGQVFQATYAVVIVLPPGDEAAADAWAYEHADLIADALQPVMYVEAIEPSLLPAEGSARGMYTLTVTGRSE